MAEIIIKNLNLSFNDKVIFSDFNLNIQENEITGLYFPSGWGKTSLLNHISQNYNSVSYAYQDLRLLESKSVIKNVSIPLQNYMNNREAKNKALIMLEKLQINDKAMQKVYTLSGGEKQLVSLARALLFDSEILLLDECFNSMDERLKKTALKVTKEELKEKPRTAIIVSHNKSDLDFLCTKILQVENTP